MTEEFEFKECDTCHSKPGSPVLCDGCLSNRETINALKQMLNKLSLRVEDIEKYMCIVRKCNDPF